MLVPNSNSCRGANPSMYNHYSAVRSGLAIPRGNLLNLNAASSNQICDTFGLHPNLTALRDMYQAKDLLFASNVGVLQRTNTNKDNWWLQTDKTELFAHNGKLRSFIPQVYHLYLHLTQLFRSTS